MVKISSSPNRVGKFFYHHLSKFFNIPFLRMKKRLLADRLKRTEDEIKQSMDEVNALFEFSDYSKFLQQLAETASRKKASGGIGTRLKQKITSSQELLKRTLSTSSASKSPRTTPEEEDVETKEVTPKAAPKVDFATSAAGVTNFLYRDPYIFSLYGQTSIFISKSADALKSFGKFFKTLKIY